MKKPDKTVLISLLAGAILGFVLSFIGGIFSSINISLILLRVIIFSFLASLLSLGILMIIKNTLPELFAIVSPSEQSEDAHSPGSNINIVLDDELNNQTQEINSDEDLGEEYSSAQVQDGEYSEIEGIDESESIASDFEQRSANKANGEVMGNSPQQLARAIRKMINDE